jgi:hypothetical protein
VDEEGRRTKKKKKKEKRKKKKRRKKKEKEEERNSGYLGGDTLRLVKATSLKGISGVVRTATGIST